MKIIYLICSLLFINGLSQEKEVLKYRGFGVCENTFNRGRIDLILTVKKESLRHDTAYNRFSFNPWIEEFTENEIVLMVVKNKYFISNGDVFDFRASGFYPFMDLDVAIGKGFIIRGVFHYPETLVTLREKHYSVTLVDTIRFYTLSQVNGSPYHGGLNSFVFSKKLGFIRFGYQFESGCEEYYFSEKLKQKWVNYSKEEAILKIAEPLKHRKRIRRQGKPSKIIYVRLSRDSASETTIIKF